MAESGKPSEDTGRSHPPPPTDPFTRFTQPWPRSEKDDENPFIQFRRFADESFNSFFSGLPSMFNSLQRTGQDLHSAFEKQLEEQLKRSAVMEEAARKEIEQSLEEMKQIFNQSQPERLQEAESTRPQPRPWWSRELHKSPASVHNDDRDRTELDAYEHSESTKDSKVDKTPCKWGSGLGWDGKVQKSRDQQEQQGLSTNESRNDNRVYCRRHTVDMDPISETLNTIPWLVLSPYSPVYLCNPDQPSAVLARFSTNFREPFHMEVLRYKDRSLGERDLDEKLARKLPWADAFEDLISLEQTGKMIDRASSTHKTPASWIHDMVKRGSLGSTWGLTSAGQLAVQKHPWLAAQSTAVESDEATDAKEAQSVLDAVRSQRAQGSSELLNHPANSKVVELGDEADEYFSGAASTTIQPRFPSSSSPATQGELSWTSSSSSSSTTWSSFSSRNYGSGSGSGSDGGETDEIISETIKTETKTFPDGSVQTKSTRTRRYADGREENETNDEFMPSPLRHQAEKQSQWQISATPVQDALKEQDNESTGTKKKGGWFWN